VVSLPDQSENAETCVWTYVVHPPSSAKPAISATRAALFNSPHKRPNVMADLFVSVNFLALNFREPGGAENHKHHVNIASSCLLKDCNALSKFGE
jgi:hypothetical protein